MPSAVAPEPPPYILDSGRAAKPDNEAQRLAALYGAQILDTLPEKDYDDLAFLAAQISGAPIALISLIDAERQWFKAKLGVGEVTGTPRDVAFCSHAILRPDELMVVPDATDDPRFADNPLVTGDMGIRFYAGAPVVVNAPDDPAGSPCALGTVCVIDRSPRAFTPEQERALRALSRQVGHLIDLRLRRILQEEEHQRVVAAQARAEALAADLRRSNAALEEFASVASHDLKEPLRKIQTFGDLLQRRASGALDESGRGYVTRMVGAAARAQTLVEGVLELAKVSRGGDAARRVPVDLNVVAAEVLSDLEARIAETGARVEVGPLPTVGADPLQMRQLIQNLIGNALKFRRPDAAPVVRVSAENDPERGRVRVTVADEGIGFDPAHAEKMFAPFERLSGRADYEGSGIGLSICRRIAEAHGGGIAAEGRPGAGATFTVTLPAG